MTEAEERAAEAIIGILSNDPICGGRFTVESVKAIAALIAAAVAEERERCARVADERVAGRRQLFEEDGPSITAKKIAAAIRAGDKG